MRNPTKRAAIAVAAAAMLSAVPAAAADVAPGGGVASDATAQVRYVINTPGRSTLILADSLGGHVRTTTTIDFELLSPTDVALGISSLVSAPLRDFGGGLLGPQGGVGTFDPHDTAMAAIERTLGAVTSPLAEHGGGLLGLQGGHAVAAPHEAGIRAAEAKNDAVTNPLGRYADGLLPAATTAADDDDEAD